MPVSELEKKAERRMSTARTEKSRPSEASFKSGVNLCYALGTYLEEKQRSGQGLLTAHHPDSDALQHQFQHQFGAKIRQHQQAEACQGEVYGGLAAPAQLVVPPQQYCKQQPGA